MAEADPKATAGIDEPAAEAPPRPAPSAPAAASGPEAQAPRASVRALWPVPTLVLGLALLAGGVVMLSRKAPRANPAAPIAMAKEAYEAHEFERAIDIVNKELLAPLAEGALKPEDAREVLLIRARSLSAGQKALAIDREENHRAVIADYEAARKRGAALGSEDIGRLAESMIAVGDGAGAAELARQLGEKEPARRVEIQRLVIEQNAARPPGSKGRDDALAAGLLREMLDQPGISDGDRAWAVARQAEAQLEEGKWEEAIAGVQRSLLRMTRLAPESRGELLYLLGRGYADGGDAARAAEQLAAAEEELPASHPLRAATLVMAGRIQQAAGSAEDAQRRFEQARQNASGGGALLAALLGLAETAAARKEDAEALEWYTRLIEEMGRWRESGGKGKVWVTAETAGRSMMDREADRASRGDAATALRYAQLAEMAALDARAEVPEPVLLAIATLSKTIGEKVMEESRGQEGGRVGVEQLPEVTRAEIKRSFHDAGEYYHRHAQRVSSSDEQAYRRSLWNSADCYDLAGDADEAKQAFSQYASGASGDDPRRLEAMFRRGQILASRRQLREAMADFRALVDARGLTGVGSGVLGDRSIVPLARCLVAEDTPDSLKAAEDLLTPVLTSGESRPDSEIYRAALVELGELLHRMGRQAEAIARLEEAVARYPSHERIGVLAYKLADANRQSAAQIDAELRETMPQSRREELQRLRAERLARAAVCYRRAVEETAAKDERQKTAMDKLVQRNSAFFIGDVAFEQGSYAEAIVAYDAARLKYSQDPASLVAMVQIVNSYVAQGKWAEAITANNRAEQQLRSLPDEVWKSEDLPMERRHWERWLDSKRLMDLQSREHAAADR